MNDWTFFGAVIEDLPVDCTGFVYLITNVISGKKYIGQKIGYSSVKRPPLKGYKRVRRSKKESDWRTYFGSSETLREDVERLGVEAFTREIIHFCKSKSEMNYLEAKEIFARDAVPSSDYYNSWVSTRVNSNQLKSYALPRH